MKTLTRLAFIPVLSLWLSVGASAQTLTIDPQHSSITFSVSNFGVNTVRGKFTSFSGRVDYDPKAPAASKTAITIQTSSVDTGNAKRDAHLRKDEFFDVEHFPAMTYTSESMDTQGDRQTLRGTLTIKGIAKPVPVTLTYQTSSTAEGKLLLKGTGTASVIREEFGIRYGNGFSIGHEVKIQLAIEAQ